MTKSFGSALDPQAVYQQFAEAQAALEQKRQSAIAELLTQRAEINKHLEALGYDGPVTVTASPTSAAKPVSESKPAKASKATGERYCPYCDMLGSHDGRAHRSQKKKKKFTQSELDAMAA